MRTVFLGVAAPRPERDLVLLVLLGVAVFLGGLGLTPLANPDEARYAEIPREMLASGDFVTPRLNDVVYFEKPPLTYWSVAASMAVFGQNEFAARLPVALFALLGVVASYFLARELGGAMAGRWAAVILGSSLLYFALARVLLTDMVVSALITTTLVFFLLGVRTPPGRRRRWFFYGLYASAAAATLAKGLIGFLLPGAVMFVWLLVYHQWSRLRPFYLPSGLVLFAVITVPWHWLMAQRNPQWADFYFVHEHFQRFTTTAHQRVQPWWYFLPVVVFGLFPWSGLLWPALRGAWPKAWLQRAEKADVGFLLIWAGFILLFFSASQSKLIPYILPVLPPLAVLGGLALTGARAAEAQAFLLRTFLVVVTVLAVALLVIAAQPQRLAKLEHGESLRMFAVAMGGILLIGAAAVWRGLRQQRPAEALRVMLLTSGGFLAVLVFAAPALARSSTRDLARVARQEIAPADRVLHYREFFHDFTFYAGRPVGVVNGAGELELALDPHAARSGRFVDEAEFARLWREPRRLYVVARAENAEEWLSRAGTGGCILARSHGHVLFTNQAAR